MNMWTDYRCTECGYWFRHRTDIPLIRTPHKHFADDGEFEPVTTEE